MDFIDKHIYLVDLLLLLLEDFSSKLVFVTG
jgi:hypothetical protein